MLLTAVAFTVELCVKGFNIMFVIPLSNLSTQVCVNKVGLKTINKPDIVHHLYINDEKNIVLLIIWL